MKTKVYRIYLGFLLLLNLLPALAPLIYKLGEHSSVFAAIAKVVYLVYSFTCHQFAWRSFAVFDYQFAWCARDTGIWFGMLLLAFLAPRLKPLRWYWVIPFIIPIALDGGVQTVATVLGVEVAGPSGAPVYISSNLIRFFTGAIFGIGVSWWLSPFFYQAFGGEQLPLLTKRFTAGLLTTSLAATFLLVTTVWTLTSPNHAPNDILDFTVKTPATNFYLRREWGPCPAGVEDLVRFDCLIGSEG